jgi:hypothetical protein
MCVTLQGGPIVTLFDHNHSYEHLLLRHTLIVSRCYFSLTTAQVACRCCAGSCPSVERLLALLMQEGAKTGFLGKTSSNFKVKSSLYSCYLGCRRLEATRTTLVLARDQARQRPDQRGSSVQAE